MAAFRGFRAFAGLMPALLAAGFFCAAMPAPEAEPAWPGAGAELTIHDIGVFQNWVPLCLGTISIRGNRRTKEQIIRQEMLFKEGDVLDAYDAQESHHLVQNLGLFVNVEFHFQAAETPGIVDLEVVVRERWTLLPQVDYARRPEGRSNIGLSLKEQNFLGRNQTLELQATYAGANDFDIPLGWEYKISFTEPRLRGSNYGLAASWRRRWDFTRLFAPGGTTVVSEYGKRSDTEALGLFRRIRGPRHIAVLLLEHEQRHYHAHSGAPPPSSINLVTLTPGYAWNRLDEYPWFTYSGFNLSARWEETPRWAGSDEGGRVATAQFLRYFNRGRWSNGVLRLLVSRTLHGGTEFERKLGGFDTLRGYENDQFRGREMWLVNLEQRFPLTKPFQKEHLMLGGAVYADAGDADFSSFAQPGDWKIGLGCGLRLYAQKIKGGVLALDAAYGAENKDWKFSVNIGQAF